VHTVLEDMPVMFVEAPGGLTGVADAWERLEAPLGSLRGRRFYGVYFKGSYRACVATTDGDVPGELGLDTALIPGGLYATAKLRDWAEHTSEIEGAFAALQDANEVDPTRPSIEFYRSQRELVLYVPIIADAQRTM